MRVGDLLWMLLALFIVIALCGALSLLIWWLWRKITLPEGAPPPKWTDFSGLRADTGHKASIVIRLAVVTILGLLMSTPVNIIYDLIRERTSSYREVVREISKSWGETQLLIGPVLSVPYTVKFTVKEEVPLSEAEKKKLLLRGDTRTTKIVLREVTETQTAIILPEELTITGRLEPELRKRGIYEVRVYTADLALSGSFKKPDFKILNENAHEVHWDKATVFVNLTDTKAFRGISLLTMGQRQYNFVPGTRGSTVTPTGFSAEVDLSGPEPVVAPTEIPPDEPDTIAFAFKMTVGGSQGFYLAPIGVTNHIKMASPWPHPSYSGDGLPTSRSEDNSQGFEAAWEVPNLVRNYPQFADVSVLSGKSRPSSDNYEYDSNYGNETQKKIPQRSLPLAEYVIGVDLFEPVFHYSILTRAVKYAMMFIALTFLSVLIFELSTARRGTSRLHLAQYGLIGLGLCLFYLVLLAASEHMEFLKAYCLAAGLNILMIGGYVWAALRRGRETLLVTAILTALYAALFFILSMEEYSLVSGTALLVLAMAALMHATRNLNGGAQAARPPDASASSPAEEGRQG